jgi:hypothetical protein
MGVQVLYVQEESFARQLELLRILADQGDFQLCAWLYPESQQKTLAGYDDRGMDVVGPDRSRLTELYRRYNDYLLDYDREIMDSVYGAL